MGIRLELENEAEVRAGMLAMEEAVEQAVESVKEEHGKAVVKEIQQTAPVRTGDYRDAWELVEENGELYAKNDIPYGPYLVYPNQRMVGSPKADKPGEGILHNVRGMVYESRDDYQKSMIQRVKAVIESG